MQLPSVFSLYSARTSALRSRMPANTAGFAGEYNTALEAAGSDPSVNFQELTILPDPAAQDGQRVSAAQPGEPAAPGQEETPQVALTLVDAGAAPQGAQTRPLPQAGRPVPVKPRLYAPPPRAASNALPLYIPKVKAGSFYVRNAGAAGLGQRIADFAKQFEGMPYVRGGEDLTSGVDCSGFTQSVFRQFGIKLPRSAYNQSKVGVQVDPENLQPGDLLFFKTDDYAPVTHVSIYIGNGKTVEAANTKLGVIISNLGKDWETRKHFVVAKRMAA